MHMSSIITIAVLVSVKQFKYSFKNIDINFVEVDSMMPIMITCTVVKQLGSACPSLHDELKPLL